MKIEGLWTAIMAVMLATAILISIVPSIISTIESADQEIRAFLAGAAIIAIFLAILFVPLAQLTQDDKGGTG